MPRPEPQPATAAARPRVAKVHDPHPAAAAAAAGNDPAVETPAPTLVPLNARVPEELRDRMRWLSYFHKRNMQDLMIEALTEYVGRHPEPPR